MLSCTLWIIQIYFLFLQNLKIMVIICIINLYQKMNLSQCHLHFKIDQILGWDWWHFLLIYRTVARGLAGWPMAHLVFGRIKDKDCKINHLRHIFFPGPPGFEMLSAALIYSKVSHKILRPVLIYILVLISRDNGEFWVVDVYFFSSFSFHWISTISLFFIWM